MESVRPSADASRVPEMEEVSSAPEPGIARDGGWIINGVDGQVIAGYSCDHRHRWW